MVYRDGACGVEVDPKQALYWMEKAQKQRPGDEDFAARIEEVRERLRSEGGDEAVEQTE